MKLDESSIINFDVDLETLRIVSRLESLLNSIPLGPII